MIVKGAVLIGALVLGWFFYRRRREAAALEARRGYTPIEIGAWEADRPPAPPQPAQPQPAPEPKPSVSEAGLQVAGLRLVVEDHQRTGSEESTTYVRTFALEGADPPLRFKVKSTYHASDRFDDHFVNVWLISAAGEEVSIYRMRDYEKYNHAQDYDETDNLDRLAEELEQRGKSRKPGALEELARKIGANYYT